MSRAVRTNVRKLIQIQVQTWQKSNTLNEPKISSCLSLTAMQRCIATKLCFSPILYPKFSDPTSSIGASMAPKIGIIISLFLPQNTLFVNRNAPDPKYLYFCKHLHKTYKFHQNRTRFRPHWRNSKFCNFCFFWGELEITKYMHRKIKFGFAEGAVRSLCQAKFHKNPSNLSPLRGKKTENRYRCDLFYRRFFYLNNGVSR